MKREGGGRREEWELVETLGPVLSTKSCVCSFCKRCWDNDGMFCFCMT